MARALVVIALCLISTTAYANGRFPEAQTIETVAGSETVYLRTTFGVLVSRDSGAHWRWICERALGYEGQWDPPIVATRDGRLWVGLEGGLLATADDGCSVERATELDGYTVKDLTTDARGETLWAITSAPGKRGYVWRRAPGGRFERLAGLDDTNLMTIEVAPTLASRVYVSGQPYSTIRGQIFRSDDGGATLRSTAVTGQPGADAGTGKALSSSAFAADGPLFIGAVDPQDPSRLLVRHLHGKGSELYLTRDGGKTFTNVLSMTSAMFGFAKSADGKTIWAGSGLPEHGLFRSIDRGEHFESVNHHGVLCLHAASASTLFVCENALTKGAPAIAVARDGVGRTITPVARFADVEGPIACPNLDARASLCAATWPQVKAQIAPPDPEPPDGGPNQSERAEGGTTNAAGSERAEGGATNAERSSRSERHEKERHEKERTSCGCEIVGHTAPDARFWWLFAGCVFLPRIGTVRGRLTAGSRRAHRLILMRRSRRNRG